MEWFRQTASCLLFGLFLVAVTGKPTTVLDVAEDAAQPTFKPTKYTLYIKTEKKHFEDSEKELTFDGEITILFDMDKPKGFDKEFNIVLNADSKMEVKEYKLDGKENDAFVSISDCKKEQKEDKLIFSCPKSNLKYLSFRMSLKYSTPFGNDMTGFYRSFYKDEKGKNRWLLATQFEPIYARKAFPCFDQPNLKANFEINIDVPKSLGGYEVLSNTICKKGKEVGEWIPFNCKKTLTPLSTYLVAFTVSDFTATSAEKFISEYNTAADKYSKEREIKTYGQKAVPNNDRELAQMAAREAVTKLTEYLGIGYAYEKIDQVGIPDFSAGAMENWGLILFREKSLFFNKATGTALTRQGNTYTITHELVHQWFGNLVTLDSWDYIWLNEAFATYVGYLIADQISFPKTEKWNYGNQFVVTETQLRAFEADGMASSKALSHHITDEKLIFPAFNDISYSKGGSVLRMWELRNPSGFKNGLNSYLNDRKEKSAKPEHLLTALKTKMGLTEEEFKSWTEQPGYPVVHVKVVNGSYILSQSRFLWDDSKADTTNWQVPITYSTDVKKTFDPTKPEILFEKELKLPKEKEKWIIVNNQQAGYYRVNYEKSNWEALSQALKEDKHSDIHELNRAQIINDIFSLARSLQKDYIDYNTALQLSEYLVKEKSLVAWKTALNSFEYLQSKVYKDSKTFKNFKEFIFKLIKPHFQKLDCTKSDHVQKLMTGQISRLACSLNYEPCVKEATELYKNHSVAIPIPDTKEIILCTVIRNDPKAFDTVYGKYESETDSSLKVMYISALGCSGNKEKVEKFLMESVNETSKIRKQDRMFVLSSVYNGNLENVDIAFNFVNNNYEKIMKQYAGINPLGKALVNLAKKFNTQEDVKKLKALKEKLEKNASAKAELESLNTAISIAESNVKWTSKKRDQVAKYLNSGSLATYSFALISLCLTFVFKF